LSILITWFLESAEKLQENADDFERIKRYAGEEKVQSIIYSMPNGMHGGVRGGLNSPYSI
jgi:hypothetical protein